MAKAKAQLKDAELALERTAVYAPFSGRVWERDVDIGQVVATGSPHVPVEATAGSEIVIRYGDAGEIKAKIE